MPQCQWRQKDPRSQDDESVEADWACQRDEHPQDLGPSGQGGHSMPPNAMGDGTWFLPEGDDE